MTNIDDIHNKTCCQYAAYGAILWIDKKPYSAVRINVIDHDPHRKCFNSFSMTDDRYVTDSREISKRRYYRKPHE